VCVLLAAAGGALLYPLPSIHAQQKPQELEPVFRVDVQLVHLLATVKSQSGQLIGGLTADDFTISENGVPQKIALFETRSEFPLSVALLIDTSSSTGIKLKQEIASVRRFLRVLLNSGNPNDSVALFTFNDVVTMQSSFASRLNRLERALTGIRASGGTSLYDAMVLASHELERRDGRKVMVVITDGADTTSHHKFHDALEALHMADSVFYSMLIVPVENDPGRSVGGENALSQFATSTGGRMFLASLGDSLDQAMSEVIKELRTQYYIAYYPQNVPPSDERYHRIELKTKNPALRVLARTGYYRVSDRKGR
jgi:Ca-activated chloride channel homolog